MVYRFSDVRGNKGLNMALPIEKQAKYWGIGAIILALMLWYLGNILLPFVLGAAIAYFLDPVADRLEAAGFTRISATAIIFIGLLLIILPAVLLAIVGTRLHTCWRKRCSSCFPVLR